MSETTRSVNRIVIRASIDDVWQELTKSGQPLPFFFGSVLHTPGYDGVAVGAPVRMRTTNGKYTAVAGEVLECEPPHRYAISFKFTQLDEPPCKVIYELKEVKDGTEFTLIVDELKPDTKTEKYMAQGRDFILTTFKAVCEKRSLPFKSRMILLMCKATEWMTPKKCRSENWP